MSQSPREEYKARQAERERKEQERLPKPWWWIGQRDPVARFTLYLGTFTLCLVAVGLLQWCSIRGQLAEMKSSGIDTHNLAVVAVLDQRAWVGSANLSLEYPTVGDVVHASVGWINSGKTPARSASPTVHLAFQPQQVENEAELMRLIKSGDSPSPGIGILSPGISFATHLDGKNVITELDEKQITADWYTYLWGELNYTDVFKERHLMTFCGYRKGIKGDFLQCPFHNDAVY
jgi:hypothetical protein